MALVSVLVVDDDVVALESTRAVLSSAGYLVTGAASGRLALHRLVASQPDILLTELLMPDGDGIELITAVKRSHPNMRIITLSAHRFMVGLDLFELAAVLGAEALLEKPVEPKTLLGTVARLAGSTKPT